MKVSVLMITYNHEKFIAQAIDSILMQQTDFEYEIVVGADLSKDRTRAILDSYKKKHPSKIKLLFPDRNLGMHRNFIQTLNSCQGQYVALLEGDDYWTSPYKLQKQVDFLDKEPSYSICFHKANVISQDTGEEILVLPPKEYQKETLTIDDLLLINFMATASVMFKRGLFHVFPDWIYNLSMLDWVLHILNSERGNIGYIDESMSVYRIHSAGVWSSKTPVQQILATLNLYNHLITYLDSSKKKVIERNVLNAYRDLMVAILTNGVFENSKKYAATFLWKTLLAMNFKLLFKDIFLVMKIYFPIFYHMSKHLRILTGKNKLFHV
jgi:glycosyltransferase involved in cell wall biosynthesis